MSAEMLRVIELHGRPPRTGPATVQDQLPLSWRPKHTPGPTTGRAAGAGVTGPAHQATILVADVLAGSRPTLQLAKWTTVRVRDEISRRVTREGSLGLSRNPARVLSCRPTEVSPEAIEVAAVAQIKGRVRALALRLEIRNGRWMVTQFTTDPGRIGS